jgi:hypothetical protein
LQIVIVIIHSERNKVTNVIERSIDGNKPRNELDLIHATENKSFIRSADQAYQNRSELELLISHKIYTFLLRSFWSFE